MSEAAFTVAWTGHLARLYAQAARDAERLRAEPDDLAEIRAVKEELDDEG